MDLIKVFITEDESIVREGLRDSIPWSRYGFEFVGDAPDGEIALPMIRKLKPDILITDIKMPFMDGLALSSIVSRELPDTKIIIISGYSDFEYARKAIEMNVDQYLLKPITKTSMIEALEQTKRKIREEQDQKEFMLRYEEEIKKYENYSRRSFFEALVEGTLSVSEIYEQASRLNIELDAEGYNFLLFTLQNPDRDPYSAEADAVLERIMNNFLRYPSYILFRCNLRSYAVLIKGSGEELGTLTDRCVETIRRQCESSPDRPKYYVAIGTPTFRLSGLSQCYADTNHTLAYRHLLPEQHIFTPETLRVEREQYTNRNSKNVDASAIDPLIIRSFIQTGLAEETDVFLQEFIDNLEGAENSMLLRHYLMVSVRINADLALTELGYDKEKLDQAVPQPEFNITVEALREYLSKVLKKAIEIRDQESQQRGNDMIEQAVKYINKNFGDENISLNTVAKATNISANYLSALFGQRMGMSFIEYLTEKRMERAKQLLRQGIKRSGEIAYEVGYRDPRYFSFVFKKTQGVTPSQYRNGEVEE